MGGELVVGAESVVDRRGDVAGGLVATVRRQIRPEDGVVDVTAEIEGQIFLQLVLIYAP